jgi:hypothetical protein
VRRTIERTNTSKDWDARFQNSDYGFFRRRGLYIAFVALFLLLLVFSIGWAMLGWPYGVDRFRGVETAAEIAVLMPGNATAASTSTAFPFGADATEVASPFGKGNPVLCRIPFFV